MDDVEELMRAAERRAEALAAGDPEALRAVLHPKFRWISHRGEMFDRESYIRTNTVGSLVWKRQQLGDLSVVVIGALLRRPHGPSASTASPLHPGS